MGSIVGADQVRHAMHVVHDTIIRARTRVPPLGTCVGVGMELADDNGPNEDRGCGEIDGCGATSSPSLNRQVARCDVHVYPSSLFVSRYRVIGFGIEPR